MIEVLDPFVCRICVCSGELSTVPYEEKDQGIYSVSVAGERERGEKVLRGKESRCSGAHPSPARRRRLISQRTILFVIDQ